MYTRRLSPADTHLLLDFLKAAPHASIAMRGMVNYGNLSMFAWYGLFNGEHLSAVGLLIPQQLALLWAVDGQDCRAIGQVFRELGAPCTAIGPQHSMSSFWSGWTSLTPQITEQTLYAAKSVPLQPVVSEFRFAKPSEATQIAKLAGAGEEEETGTNTFVHHPKRLLDLVKTRIERKHTWVIEHQGQIAMQVHVAPVLPEVCQLVGTYVPPAFRGQGWSTKGVNGLLHSMIPTGRTVVLRVDKTNTPALRCYKSNGFVALMPFSVFNPPK